MPSPEQEHEFSFKSLFVPFTPFKAVQWIIAIGFLVYANMLFNGFVWDDIGQIVSNPSIQNISNIFAFFTGSTFYSGGATSLSGIFYKPLLPLIFSITYSAWGLNSFGYHFFSLILHIANSILIYVIFTKLFKNSAQKYSKIITFLLSLLFLVHPTNVEAVAYISAIQELLYVFFLLLSFLLVISFKSKEKASTTRLVLISLFFLLSLLSKETGILTFPILTAYVLLFNPSKTKQLLTTLSASFIVYLILRFGIAKVYLGSYAVASPIVNAPLISRLITIPYELASYARLTFFPKDLFISQSIVVHSIYDSRFYIPLIFVVIVFSIFGFLAYKFKSKVIFFFLIWVTISFAMIVNIYPLDFTLAERWMYGPLIGILGFLGTVLIQIKNKKIVITFITIICLITPIFATRTMMRNLDWKDNMTLFSHDIISNPTSFEIQEDYGTLLVNSGNVTDGEKHLLEAIRLSPTWWGAYTNIGLLYIQEHQYQKAQSYFLYAIKNGRDYGAYEALAVLEYKNNDLKKTMLVAQEGLKYYPNNPTLNLVAALVYYKEHDIVSAKFYANNAYTLHPTTQTYTALMTIINGGNVDSIIK